MNDQFQINLLRLQADLHTRLGSVRDVRKALVHGVRAAREVFGAEHAAVATLKPGRSTADVVFTIPKKAAWDGKLLTQYIAGARPDIPWNILMAPVRRRGRNWAALALENKSARFTADQRQALFSITQTLTDIVQAVDDERTRGVRRKIEQKIADRQEAKDLIYDILHGLRSLTYYDHSASLLISRDGSEPLELVAEQIAWTKAKSKRIGLRLVMDDSLRAMLSVMGVHVYERTRDSWRHVHDDCDPRLPELLYYQASSGDSVPPELGMVCAPIATPDGTLGVLKISARRRGVLADFEAALVEEFVPLTSLAVQFAVRTESLQERILQAERKHALANLTRGITHDVNNALGAMLPLVQQMREDVDIGQMTPRTLTGDLKSLERSIQTCRRIFGGMLAIARGSSHGIGHGNLRRALESVLSVLEDSLNRRSVEVELDLPEELPTIHGSQGDLTQLFLNICTNARDAMPGGGRLSIVVRCDNGTVQVQVRDTGAGISSDDLERVFEPFFTTKIDGSGLGLSICRSILWDIGGDMKIDSEEGKGTCSFISLPVLEGESREDTV
jgi:two-component system NtrC family sensor kinase